MFEPTKQRRLTQLLAALAAICALAFGGRIVAAQPLPAETAEAHGAPPGEPAEAPAAHHGGEAEDADFPAVLDPAQEAALGTTKDPKLFAGALRGLIGVVRTKVLTKLEEKIEAKQEETMGRVSMVLFLFSLCGVFLLGMPIVLAKKHPGRTGVLFKYSAVAALIFFVSVNLFAGVVLVLRSVQGATAALTNPQIALVTATLDTLDDDAEQLVTDGATIIEPTLDQLQRGDTDEPVAVALIDNVARTAKGAAGLVEPLLSVASLLREVNWIFGYVPTLLALITVLLFVLATRPMLREIVGLPGRAASGDPAAARAVMRAVGLRIWNELRATLGVIVTLVLVSILSGVCLSLAVRPAVETLLDYLFAAVQYIQVPDASGTTLLVSLSGAILFALLNVAVILAASSFFVGKVQKILQARFHDQVPLGHHKKFWIWGPLSLLLVLLLPFAFSEVAKPFVEGPITSTFLKGGEVAWTGYFLSGPLTFVLGFLFVFWAARGLKGLMFLKRYPVVLAPPPVPAAPLAAALPAV